MVTIMRYVLQLIPICVIIVWVSSSRTGCWIQNIFVHFEPLGPKDEPLETYDAELDLPPYLIPDSQWITQWRKEHPKGWYEVRTRTCEDDMRG